MTHFTSFNFQLQFLSNSLRMLPLEYHLHYLSPLAHNKSKIYLSSHHQTSLFSLVNFRVRPSLCRFQCLASHNSRWVCRSTGETDSVTGSSSGEEKTEDGPVVEDADSASSGSDKRREKQKGWRLSELRREPIVESTEIGVLLLQFGILIFLTRFWSRGKAPTTFVNVPYSEFLNRVNGNQVRKVKVDGVHVIFKLKSSVGNVLGGGTRLHESESLVKGVAPTKKIVFTTTRPSDIQTPYEKLLENEVEFRTLDKRSGGFFKTALIVSCYVVVLVGFLRGFSKIFSPQTTGQIWNHKSGTSDTKSSEQGETVTSDTMSSEQGETVTSDTKSYEQDIQE